MSRAGIRAVVEAVERIPVVANGDIRTIADAAATFEETGCAAISIGRGSLANPFLFRQLDCWSRTGDPGPEPDFRRTDRADVPPFPRPGRAPGRAARLPSVPQDPQVVLSFHADAETVLPSLLNLSSPALFEEVIDEARAAGPDSPLPGHYDLHVPVPAGAIDKW